MVTIRVSNILVIILRFRSSLYTTFRKRDMFFRRKKAEKNSSGWSIWKCYSLSLDYNRDRL